MSPLPPDLTVKTWPDAIGVAFALADEFAHLHAGLLIDPSGRVASIRLHTLKSPPSDPGRLVQPHAGFDPVLRWLVRQPHTWPAPANRGSVLLVSVGTLYFEVAADARRQLFLKAQHAAELSGYHLFDIIETDGDCIRSFAYLVDPGTSRHRSNSDFGSGIRYPHL